MQVQQIHDVVCSGGPGHAPGSDVHSLEPRRIVQKAVDLVGKNRQVVAAYRNALLKEMIRVPLLLSWYGIDNNEGQASGKSLGTGKATRFS